MNRSLGPALLITAGFAGLLAATLSLTDRAPARADGPAIAASTVDDGAPRFELGRTDRYAVTWTTTATAALPGDDTPIDVRSHLVGELVLTTTDVGEDVVQAMTLTDLSELRVRVGAESLDIDHAEIEGAVALVFRTAEGDVIDILFAPDTTAPAKNLLAGLARTALIEYPGDGERYTPYGTAQDRWDGDVRTTTGYASVDAAPFTTPTASGTARVRLGHGGRLVALSADEQVVARDGSTDVFAATDHIVVSWIGQRLLPVTAPFETASHTASAPTTRADSRSSSDVLAELTAFDAGGVDVDELMWAGTARIAADPALAADVAAVVRAPAATRQTRELGLDLLAHAVHPAAQQALIDALSDPTLLDDPAYPAYLQRLTFVRGPTDDTIAFAHAQLAGPDIVRRSVLASIGGLASHSADPDAVLAPVRGYAGSAPEDRAARLVGLGNAAQPADQPDLLSALSDKDAGVRAAAIHALRAFDGPDVRQALRAALRDPGVAVQRAALVRLGERPLDPTDLTALRDLAQSTELDGTNLQIAVSALAPVSSEPLAREALAALVDHPRGDPRSRARIRALLTVE